MILVIREEEEDIYEDLLKAYTSGLTIEEQEVKTNKRKIEMEFIGLDIEIWRKTGAMTVRLKNDNARKGGIRQKKPRFPSWEDYRPVSMVKGVMKAMIQRCRDYPVTWYGVEESIMDLKVE